MRVVALISGGKDSCFNMMHVHAEGHTIVALANLYPDENGSDELDSYMYQTVGHEAIGLYSEAMDLPLFRRKITGHSKSLDLDYVPNEMDEVEDLYELLREISKSVKFDAVSSGAILSDYQRIRVESVCHRLGLKSLSYLWQRNQEELLQEMISCGLKAILIKTAALGLEPTKHLGKTLEEMCETLHSLNEKYGCHVCGEGGEFETFTLDCPLFKKEIIVDESQICIHSDDFSAPVGYLKLKKMHLKQKIEPSGIIEDLPLTTSTKWANKFLSGMKYKDAIEMNSTVTMPQSSNIIHSKETLVHSSYEGKFIRVSNLYGNTLEKQTPEMIENVTVEVLKKLEDILWQQGHALKDVCYIQIYVSNMSDYEFINKAYLQFFDRSPPARTCIGCINRGQFGMGKTILQISATSCKEYSSRRALHVQSISHWSPPNIGPFSQCVSVDKILFVSGTIGLVPGSMKLISGGAKSESILALAHVGRVMNVMPGTESTKIVQSICYVNSINDIQYGLAAWEDASSTCKPIYLVVKELPKCAKAEWQVIGYKTSDTIEKNLSDSAIVKQDGLKICQTSRLISTDNAKIYSYVASVAIPSNNDLCDVGHYLEGLYQDMSNWMEQRALQPADITQLFLFSCVEGASPISLNEMWNKSSGADIQYVPTWDHYCALQFLRKPYEEGVGEELSNSVGMLEDGEEYEDAVTEDPKQDEPSKSNGFDWNKLVRQLDQTRSGENDKTDGEVDYINEGASSAVMDSVKSESPSEFSQYSVVQPPTPSQLIRKHRTPRQRRWTPGYNKKYQEIANVASASISSNTSNTNAPIQPPLEPIRTSTENEAFTQYIASVLDRFPADKQRRCRNEILCVLLQYDSCEDNVILSTASDRK